MPRVTQLLRFWRGMVAIPTAGALVPTSRGAAASTAALAVGDASNASIALDFRGRTPVEVVAIVVATVAVVRRWAARWGIGARREVVDAPEVDEHAVSQCLLFPEVRTSPPETYAAVVPGALVLRDRQAHSNGDRTGVACPGSKPLGRQVAGGCSGVVDISDPA